MDLVALAPPWVAMIFVALLLLAAFQDAVQLKISNILCAALFVAGLAVALIVGPTWSLCQNVLVFAGFLAIGTWLFGKGMMGGGDVKLLATTAFWFDLESNFRLVVAMAIFGGLIGLLLIFARKISSKRARPAKLQRSADIPYGVAIAAGAIFTVLGPWQGQF